VRRLQGLSDLKGARAHLEEAVRVWKSSLGRDDLLTALGLNRLGNVQWELREYAAAKKSHEEALAIYSNTLPKDHPVAWWPACGACPMRRRIN
jgi:hypothetical protein